MNAYFDNGHLKRSEAIGNVQTVYYPIEARDSTLIGLCYLETDTMRMFLDSIQKLDKIWASKSEGVLYPMTQIPAGKQLLPNFGWYDYIRPIDKDDIYYKEGVHDKNNRNNGAAPAAYALTRRMRMVKVK